MRGAVECHPAPSPTSCSFTFSNLFTDQPVRRTPERRSPASSSDRCNSFPSTCSGADQEPRRHIPGSFAQDDWRVTNSLTINAGVRYTLNFPSTEVDDQAAVFNLQTQQLEYLGQNGVPASARRLHKNDFRSPPQRYRRPPERQDSGSRRLWPNLDRAGWHYHAVHHAGVPVPADRLAANARQHRARLHARQRADGNAHSAHAQRRAWAGRLRRGQRAGLGLCAAVERVGSTRPTSTNLTADRVPRARQSRTSASPTRT